MAVRPENNRMIVQRMKYELADAIMAADYNQLHIDDALIAVATPAVLINYKGLTSGDMMKIMTPLERFFKRNPRFLEFTKEAVAEGLRLEWLPTLDADDKAELLSDFKLVRGVTEEGIIDYNHTIFTNLTRIEHPDNEVYKKKSYTPRPSKGGRSASSRERIVLTDVAPDAALSEKLKSYIAWYKAHWSELHPLEEYKWEAVKWFHDHFDIEAKDIAENLKVSFSKHENLLGGPMYMPLSMLMKNARLSPDDVRTALGKLYDESRPLSDRVAEFLSDFNDIHQRNVAAGHLRQNERDMQSERAVSVYLAFRYPASHYLFKSSVWTGFKDEVGLDYPSLTRFPSKLFGYERIASHIKAVLLADSELTALLQQSQPDDSSAGNLLTQDFMYCISYHMSAMTK